MLVMMMCAVSGRHRGPHIANSSWYCSSESATQQSQQLGRGGRTYSLYSQATTISRLSPAAGNSMAEHTSYFSRSVSKSADRRADFTWLWMLVTCSVLAVTGSGVPCSRLISIAGLVVSVSWYCDQNCCAIAKYRFWFPSLIDHGCKLLILSSGASS